MMTPLLKSSAISLVLLFLQTASAKIFSFIHINDHHSNLDELTVDLVGTAQVPPGLSVNATTVRFAYGGAPRIGALIKKLRSDATTAGKGVVTVHGGDAITGTLFYSAFKGAADAAYMNEVGFDAMVIGNHEFDDGDAGLANFTNMLNAPIISYNLKPAKESSLLKLKFVKRIKPYQIKTFPDNDKIGICAITIKLTTEQSSSPDKGTTLDEEIQAAKDCVAEVSELGINKILLITHIGYDNDLAKMANITGVDVIIGGHSHTLLGSPTSFANTPFLSQGPYATVVNKTCIVQAFEYNKGVGNLDVDFDANGEVVSCNGNYLIPFNDATISKRVPTPVATLSAADITVVKNYLIGKGVFTAITPDANIDNILQPYKTQLTALGNQVIALALETMCHQRTIGNADPNCPTKLSRTAVGGGVCNIVAQGFLYNAKTADVAIQNGGGCRTSIFAGNFTFGAASTLLPFSNVLVTIKVTGDQIRRVLEDAMRFYLDLGGGTGPYPFSAGLRWKLDFTAPYGSRFSDIQVNIRLNSTWQPLNLTRTYTVVTNDFIATPRDGYDTFGEVNKSNPDLYQNTYILYTQSLLNYASFLKNISDPPISVYSTQRLKIANGTVFDLGLEISKAPTKAPTKKPVIATASPVKKPTFAPAKEVCNVPRFCTRRKQCCGRPCIFFLCA